MHLNLIGLMYMDILNSHSTAIATLTRLKFLISHNPRGNTVIEIIKTNFKLIVFDKHAQSPH
jgi:hypothetical protein